MIKLMKSPLGEDEIKIVQEDHQDINQIEQLNPRHLLERSNKKSLPIIPTKFGDYQQLDS